MLNRLRYRFVARKRASILILIIIWTWSVVAAAPEAQAQSQSFFDDFENGTVGQPPGELDPQVGAWTREGADRLVVHNQASAGFAPFNGLQFAENARAGGIPSLVANVANFATVGDPIHVSLGYRVATIPDEVIVGSVRLIDGEAAGNQLYVIVNMFDDGVVLVGDAAVVVERLNAEGNANAWNTLDINYESGSGLYDFTINGGTPQTVSVPLPTLAAGGEYDASGLLERVRLSTASANSQWYFDDVSVVGGLPRTPATTFTWSSDASADWRSLAWDIDIGTSGTIPDSDQDTAIFGGNIQSDQSVYLNTTATARRLEFNNALAKYSITGPGSLTLDGNASIEVLAGDHEIEVDIQLADDDLTITTADNSTLDINEPIDLNGRNLTISTGTISAINFNGGLIGGGTLTSSGTLGTDGATGIDGDLTSNGTLAIDVGGTLPALFDSLSVNGVATLNGTLDVILDPSFTPGASDTWDIVTASSIASGSSIALDPADEEMFDLDIVGNILQLSVVSVPEPSTGMLLLLGAIGWVLRLRNKGTWKTSGFRFVYRKPAALLMVTLYLLAAAPSSEAQSFSGNFEDGTVGSPPGEFDPQVGTWEALNPGDGNLDLEVHNATSAGFAAFKGDQFVEVSRLGGAASLFGNLGFLPTLGTPFSISAAVRNVTGVGSLRLHDTGAVGNQAMLHVQVFGPNSGAAGLIRASDVVVKAVDLTATNNVGEWNTLVVDYVTGVGDYTITVNGGTPQTVSIPLPDTGAGGEYDSTGILNRFSFVTAMNDTEMYWDDVSVSGTPPPPATTFTWRSDASGDWRRSPAWAIPPGTSGTFPDSDQHTAIFGGNILTDQTVFINTTATARRLEFNNAASKYSIGGPGSLTLDGNVSIEVFAGDHEIEVDIQLVDDDLTITTADNSSLDINEPVDLNGQTMTIATGTTASSVNLNGGATGAGTVMSTGRLGTAGATVIDGNLTSSGTLAIDIGGTLPDFFDSLSVNGTAMLNGTLDVTLDPSFTPGVSDEWDIVTATTIAGGSSIVLDAADENMFNLNIVGNILRLTVGGVGATDFDNSGTWDLPDLNLVLFNWQQPEASLPGTWVHQRPAVVGLESLNLVLFNWQQPSSIASVPEPTTAALGLMALVGICVCRRRRAAFSESAGRGR